jgi:hypothetical protein
MTESLRWVEMLVCCSVMARAGSRPAPHHATRCICDIHHVPFSDKQRLHMMYMATHVLLLVLLTLQHPTAHLAASYCSPCSILLQQQYYRVCTGCWVIPAAMSDSSHISGLTLYRYATSLKPLYPPV